jgi:hypothetical protein
MTNENNTGDNVLRDVVYKIPYDIFFPIHYAYLQLVSAKHVVVSHKLCGFQGRLGGHVVMMKEPVVVVPKFRSFFIAHFRSSISKRHSKSQELTVVLGGTNSQ